MAVDLRTAILRRLEGNTRKRARVNKINRTRDALGGGPFPVKKQPPRLPGGNLGGPPRFDTVYPGGSSTFNESTNIRRVGSPVRFNSPGLSGTRPASLMPGRSQGIRNALDEFRRIGDTTPAVNERPRRRRTGGGVPNPEAVLRRLSGGR